MTPRIEPLAHEHTAPDAVGLLLAAKRKTGMVPNAYRVMAHAPALLRGYLDMAGAMEGGVLTRRLREQIALAIASRNQCAYCLAAHRIGGRFAGLSAQEIAQAEQGCASDAKEAAALALALGIAARAGDVDEAAFAEARAVGLTEAEIIELTGHVALNTLTNMINRLARTPNDFEGRGLKLATEVMVRLGVSG